MENCKSVNLSIKPNEYKRLTKKNKIKWDKCYLAYLTRRKAHTKKARKRRDINELIKGVKISIEALEK